MADRNGYIGRAPGDSAVIIARQTYAPTGIQTDFTFDATYTPGYMDVYLNGVRLVILLTILQVMVAQLDLQLMPLVEILLS